MLNFDIVKNADPEIAQVLYDELKRQQEHLELIASENFVHEAVLQAAGSHLTNKYAEGYPGKRYYGGCVHVDIAEDLARDRAKKLFGADHANVQPHSGSQANAAAYAALVEQGDTIMGLNLSHGGHLTHGSPVNFSGKTYNFVTYGVDPETEVLDYGHLHDMAMQHKPKMIIAGASAYPRAMDFKRFREIADDCGAFLLVDMAHIAGLVAVGLHQSPVPYAHIVTTTTHKTLRGPRSGMILCTEEFAKAVDKAVFPGMQGGPLMHIVAAKAVCFKLAMQDDFKAYQQQIINNAKALAEALTTEGIRLVSGGTDTHLMLADLTKNGVTGKEIEGLLGMANITVNKNTIPNETQSPFVTSGIRIGTPAVTTRGMKENDMQRIGSLIARIIKNGESCVEDVKKDVLDICSNFPLYA